MMLSMMNKRRSEDGRGTTATAIAAAAAAVAVLASACLLGMVRPSSATEKTKASIKTELNTNWADNTVGGITPALLRGVVIDIVDSYAGPLDPVESIGVVANNCAAVQVADQAAGSALQLGAITTSPGPGAAGHAACIKFVPTGTGDANRLDIAAVNGRVQLQSTGGIGNPTLVLSDQQNGQYGAPVLLGNNTAGVGFTVNGTASGASQTFNFVNAGRSSGASGERNSAILQIWGTSLLGDTQNIIGFYNGTGCDTAACHPGTATQAGMRLGEIGGWGMSTDGLFTQTETVSINFYADANFTGAANDGFYTAKSNIVFRAATQTNTAEGNIAGFYVGALALGTYNVSGNSFPCGIGCLILKDQLSSPGAGVTNSSVVYSKGGTLYFMNSAGAESAVIGTGIDNVFTIAQTLQDSAANAGFATTLDFYKNRASTNSDLTGGINFKGNNSIAAVKAFATIVGQIGSKTSGAEYGILAVQNYVNGGVVNTLTVGCASAGGVIVGAPTGSCQGTGTLNATGLYVNGTAVLTANQSITISGDASGSGTTSISLTLATVGVGKGGTGQTTLTSHGLLVGNGAGAVVSLAAAAADTVFMGNGAADPGAVAVTNCAGGANALNYSTSSHAWSCNNIAASGVSLLSGAVLAKTANYTALTADCGSSLALSGGQFTLTLNAASGYASSCGFLITNVASETRSKSVAPNGLTSFLLYPGQSVVVSNQSNTWTVGPIAGRWRASAQIDFYVRPDGSDSNDGLANSSGGAFQTANAAIAAVMQSVDINQQTVNINHTCASPPCTISTAAQLLRQTGGGNFVGGVPNYKGDCTTPTNMILAPGTSQQADIQVTFDMKLNVCGFKLAGGANVSNCMYISGGARVNLNGPMEFGDCTAGPLVNSGGQLDLNGNITVSHGLSYVFSPQHLGFIENGSALTMTLSGTPAWGNAYVYAVFEGVANLTTSITYSGSATGSRYNIQYNSLVDNSGSACAGFPGNAAGTAANNGLCY